MRTRKEILDEIPEIDYNLRDDEIYNLNVSIHDYLKDVIDEIEAEVNKLRDLLMDLSISKPDVIEECFDGLVDLSEKLY